MFDILRDLRDAFRSARRQPGMTLVIVLTLAVGIGASTAIFTYFVELYWHRLDAPDAERMYYVYTGTVEEPDQGTSYPDAQLYREALADLGTVAPWVLFVATLTVPEEGSQPGKTVVRAGSAVSPEHFDLFGVHFTLGRDFLPEEHRPGGPPVAVIDHTFWSRHLGADPAVLGRTLRLNGHPFTVVGVTQRGFENDGLPRAVYVPVARYDELAGAAVLADREARRFDCLLRLEQGVRPEVAEARLAVVGKNLDREHPWSEGAARHVTVGPIQAMRFDLTAAEMMMAGSVGLLLLLACANVANLLLARAAGRRREIAILAALGAGPGRIARRLLTESGFLAIAGGGLGLLVARWLLAVIRRYTEKMAFGYAHLWEGDEWVRYDDHRVLGFTLLVALGTVCLFGLAPIFHTARTDLVSALQSGGAEPPPGRRLGARHLLVITQVALATTLLLLAGLLVRSLQGLENRELGFETERQLMAALMVVAPPVPSEGAASTPSTDAAAQQRAAWRGLYEAARQRLATLPGVEAATLTTAIPGTNKSGGAHAAFPDLPGEAFWVEAVQQVGPDFFETFAIPLVRGRSFDLRDRAGAVGAVIVNQAFVDRFFQGGEPIGQDLLWPDLVTDAAEGRFRVVGVIPNIRHQSRLEEPGPLAYLPLSQYLRPRFRARLDAVARTSQPPRAMIPAARRALSAVHPDLAVVELGTYKGVTNDVQSPKFHSVLSGLFSLFALALASLGIYGVTSCSQSYRLREFGVRMTLGATGHDLVHLVLAEAFRLTAAGVLLGVGLSLALTRLVSSILYGISVADPLTFLTVPAVLAAVGVAAAWLPAWRAGRVDPKVVLQEE